MHDMTHADEPRARFADLLAGLMPFQLAYTMARLGLADLLDGGAITVGELSDMTSAHPQPLRRFLRGLAGIGLVALEHDDRVSLTEMGALLGSRDPASLRDVVLHRGGPVAAAWGELPRALRTGESAFEAAHGVSFFDYMRLNANAGHTFDGAMATLSQDVIAEAIAHYDYAFATSVLDIGGGRGHFVAAVLDAYPELEGAVFDVPEVVATARRDLRERRLDDRCAAIAGDFFTSLPPGYDLHILKWILHNWNDAACRALLTASRAALPDNGRLLIVEQLLPDAAPDPDGLHPAVRMDLMMLVNFADARERRLDEYRELVESCGFSIHAATALPSAYSIIDCRPRIA
jgi:protein-L-isoaspartate O-methyltransferase